MENSQNSSLITFLMNLGILPCLGILLLLFGLFFIFIKWLSHDKPEEYSDSVGCLLSYFFILQRPLALRQAGSG